MRRLDTVAIALALAASWPAPALAGEVEALDATGAQVALAAPAHRIVSLAPHATELLFVAGAGERVVGVLDPANWPPQAARRPAGWSSTASTRNEPST